MHKITSIMNEWKFSKLSSMEETLSRSYEIVQLPHVWNMDLPKEEGRVLYEKNLSVSKHAEAEYLLSFDAVGGIAEVYLNGEKLGVHRGSYSRFCFNITNILHDGDNLLQVYADNRRDGNINPVTGDFSYFGGIYRDVTFIETGKAYFDRTYYGTSGVLIRTEADGKIHLQAHAENIENAVICYQIKDAQKNIATEKTVAGIEQEAELMINEPHLWNGRKDPYCYTCDAKLMINGIVSDEVSLDFGFRSISISSETGFSLNGSHLRLNGVAKHQDYEGYACAAGKEQIERDFSLIDEIGANAIRFSHYQHPQYAYDLADHMGFAAWAEIPMLAMEDGNEKLIENAEEQLKELILQNLHHPSICFWGLQNEIGMRGESLATYANMKKLEADAKRLDPSRFTACAEVFSVPNHSELNFIHDAVGYNLYYGWYTGEFPDYIPFAEKFHKENPDVPLAVTEYGADCNLQYHTSTPERQDYTEEYQALFHESVYQYLEKIPFLWGTFVWNMFDFSSAVRDEGGIPQRNMKGLVTYDRKIKKDSFYFYRASWSKTPFVHLCGCRYVHRHEKTTSIKVYSNEPEVTLFVDGKEYQTIKGNRVFVFEGVPMQKSILVEAVGHSQEIHDEMILKYVEEDDPLYIYPKKQSGNVANWFAENIGKGSLSIEGHYSVNDRIMDLLSNQEAAEVLEAYLPQVIHDERTKMFGGMTLLRVIDRSHAELTQEQLVELNHQLHKISK